MFSYSILNIVIVFLKMLFSFLITKYIALTGGPIAIAYLGQFQSLLSIFQNLPNGTSNGVIAITPKSDNKKGIWAASFYIGVGVFSLLLISAFFSKQLMIVVFSDSSFSKYYIFLVILYPLYHLYSLLNAINTSQEKFKLYFKSNIIMMIIYILTMLSFKFYFSIGDIYIWTALFIPLCSVGICLFNIFYDKSFSFNFKSPKIEQISGILKFFFASLVSVVFTPIILIIIRNIISDNYNDIIMGNWQAMWRISELYTTVIMLSISSIILPKFANSKSALEIRHVFLSSLKIVIPLYIICFSIIFFKTDFIISLLYSSNFVISKVALLYQLLGDFFKIGCWLFTYLLISQFRLKITVFLEVFMGIVFVSFSKLLIVNYGVSGISISYLITQAVVFFILFFVCNKYIFGGYNEI